MSVDHGHDHDDHHEAPAVSSGGGGGGGSMGSIGLGATVAALVVGLLCIF